MIASENATRFVRSLYPLGLMLTVVPLVDWVAKIYPFFPRVVQWRFGAEASLVAVLAIVLVGLAILGGIAAFCGHRRVLRVLSLIAGLGALLMTIMLAAFLLDAVQMVGKTDEPSLRAGMVKALISGLLTTAMGIVVLGSFAFGAHRATKHDKATPRRSAEPVLIRKAAPDETHGA